METTPTPWPEVGAAIRARLGQLPESQARIVARCGVSKNTFRYLLQGKEGPYRAATLTRVSLGLWGQADAIARVLAGQTPTAEVEPMGLVSTGWGDLHELQKLDPAAFGQVMDAVSLHLERARQVRGIR